MVPDLCVKRNAYEEDIHGFAARAARDKLLEIERIWERHVHDFHEDRHIVEAHGHGTRRVERLLSMLARLGLEKGKSELRIKRRRACLAQARNPIGGCDQRRLTRCAACSAWRASRCFAVSGAENNAMLVVIFHPFARPQQRDLDIRFRHVERGGGFGGRIIKDIAQ